MSTPFASSSQPYDYIIVGAGCAGLSLLMRMLDEPALAGKRILLVDKATKTSNDRTWCFWEDGDGYFENLVHHRWQRLWVKHAQGTLQLKPGGYQYKMIRGIDFYRFCFARLRACSNVHLVYGNVTDIDAEAGRVTVDGFVYEAGTVFSSVLLQPPQLKPRQLYLLQHFRGWWIETDEDVFDAGEADLMNFRTGQQHGCAFVYVLPVSSRRALVEYTLFTEEELADAEYDAGLKLFLQEQLKLEQYRITEVENGIIPMTDAHFPRQQDKVVFIGTAGGRTKASSGYTFQFIQKQSAALAQSLATTGGTNVPADQVRFHFYDSVMLRVLHERKLTGADVFYQLFKKNPATRIFRFLDNESSLLQDLALMNSTDKTVFVPTAMRVLAGI
jgi:lycopene beta-cyclase